MRVWIEARQAVAGAQVLRAVLLLAVRGILHEAAVHHPFLPLHLLHFRASRNDAEGHFLLHEAAADPASRPQARGSPARGHAAEEEIVGCVCS